MARTPTGESSLARAIRLLDSFQPSESAITVTELALRARLPVPTASRLVAELVRLGMLERTPDRMVRPGVRLWEIASRSSSTMALRSAAMPILREAHNRVGHHLHLAILDHDEVLFIERLSAPAAVINYSQIAGRLPWHASAAGQILMAFTPLDVRERALSEQLAAVTARTITDANQLRATLDRACLDGYAKVDGSLHRAASGVAVPIRTGTDHVIAAVSAVVPVGTGDQYVPILRAAARALGRALGSSRSVATEENPRRVSQLLRDRWGR